MNLINNLLGGHCLGSSMTRRNTEGKITMFELGHPGFDCGIQWCKFVIRRKGNNVTILAIKDHKGTIITDSTDKANVLISYYSSVVCSDYNIPKRHLANSGETFIITTKIIRKILLKVGRKKTVRPDGVSDQILKLGVEAINSFQARSLEIALNNFTIRND